MRSVLLTPLVSLLVGCAAPATPDDVTAQARTPSAAPRAWRDDFSGSALSSRWSVSSGTWPAFWATSTVRGNFAAPQVTLDGQGHLKLAMTATRQSDGTVQVSAAELATVATHGYGTYEARLRAASTSADPQVRGEPRSGTVSAFFNYVNNAETELDWEFEGRAPGAAWVGTWQGVGTHAAQQVPVADASADWHTYRWEWRRAAVTFSVDGHEIWRTTQSPRTAAHVMLNLWPTDSGNWGGLNSAAPGAPQQVFMLVDYVSYAP